ncbi:MAG: DUF928 domain-containing protein [Alphaproteobacteria bacterium]|nr:DUF928 domain-containing protein [Alphaproteobacteria bacterium]
MMSNKRILISGLAAIGVLAAAHGHAEDKPAAETGAPSASEQDIAEALKSLVFVPHDTGAPEVTDAGGVRGVTVLPKIELLAPEGMARTLSPTPTLYWHVSKAAEGPVRFTLLADDVTAIDPLLEINLGGVDQEGIYGLSLDDHGITLEHGERYVWSVALASVGGNYGSDMVAQTMMEHVAAPELAKAVDAARPEERAVRLAAEGYWYDAVDVLSEQIETAANAPWQAARAHLLDQAGLLRAARFDRGARPQR